MGAQDVGGERTASRWVPTWGAHLGGRLGTEYFSQRWAENATRAVGPGAVIGFQESGARDAGKYTVRIGLSV